MLIGRKHGEDVLLDAASLCHAHESLGSLTKFSATHFADRSAGTVARRMMQDAVAVSEASISHTLHKTRVWDKLHPLNLNDRQTMIVNMLIDGFTGKLTAEKWAKICKCSHATAVRDINEMIHLGILLKDSGKARNTAYELSQEFRI